MKFLPILILAATVVFTGCSDKEEEKKGSAGADYVVPTNPNAVAVNAQTRSNLGITFAEVERRPVRRTYRLPGQFELRPEAFSEYTATFAGRVDLSVKQYEKVKKGQVLFSINSPEWRRLQHELGEALNSVTVKSGQIVVAQKNVEEAESVLKVVRERIKRLALVNVRKAELDAEAAGAVKRIEVLKAEKILVDKEFKAAKDHYRVMIHTASSLTGIADEELVKVVAYNGKEVPRWQTIDTIVFRAQVEGVVQTLGVTDGGWAETGASVVRCVDPAKLRFRAEALQSDLLKFKNGMSARIVPPQGSSVAIDSFMTGQVTVGFEGDARQRTIPLFVVPEKLEAWCSAGVAAYLEVFTEGAETPELAVPKRSIIRDGMVDIFFRRNPKNPDEVIRVEADLGVDDGRWIVVKSGVRKGDEVVLEGAYELKLATAGSGGKKQEKGHFHADGKWCSGEH